MILPSGLAVYVGNILNSDIGIFHKFLSSLATFPISKTIHKVVNVKSQITHTHTHTHTSDKMESAARGVWGWYTHTSLGIRLTMHVFVNII